MLTESYKLFNFQNCLSVFFKQYKYNFSNFKCVFNAIINYNLQIVN